MSLSIQPAQPHHADVICAIIVNAFDDDVSAEVIAAIIATQQHTTLIALDADRVVGFLDGFPTTAADEITRYELDLLAVHSDYRGQGIGQQLITAFTEIAQSQAQQIRVLVAAKNAPMHRSMQQTGYTLQPEICDLYVTSVPSVPETTASDNHATRIIPVQTFTYRGYWLEGVITSNALQTIKLQPDEIIGAVIPRRAENNRAIITAANFGIIGQYQWWLK